jgi:hypothetical protein
MDLTNLDSVFELINKSLQEKYYSMGRLEQAVYSVILILRSKFGYIDDEIKEKIIKTDNIEQLNSLLEKAVHFDSIYQVNKYL